MNIDALMPGLRPPTLGSSALLTAVNRTNASLARVQTQLALGRAMLAASDDPARSAALSRLTASLDQSLARSGMLARAADLLAASDGPLASAIDLLGEATALVSVDATASLKIDERQAIAAQLDQLLAKLVTAGNTVFDGVELFGGTRIGQPAWLHRADGVLYMGRGGGLDIGLGEIATISGHEAFGGVSRRIELAGTANLANGYDTSIAAWWPASPAPLGSIKVTVGSQTQIVDLSQVTTLRQLKNTLEGLDMGLRVEFDAATGKAWVRNALSGPGLSISDLPGDSTATALGIDTFATYTLLSDFNDGAGVRFAVPGVDPLTGGASSSNGEDFRVILHDGRSFDVDLTTEQSAGAVLATINAAAAAAGITPAEFTASMQVGSNGFVFVDTTVGPTGFEIQTLNSSFAAHDLGIVQWTGTATIAGTDRAQVAVDGAHTWLLRLRDAVLAGDAPGIQIAFQGIDRAVSRASSARSGAGARAARLADERGALEEIVLQQQSLKSLLGEVDVAEASTRLSALSMQLEAGLYALSRAGSMSLLRYLG